ncbi:MAG: tetratricopeptide repeat protein [Symplocastrum torsivum CPER-KK1]|jgi:tetratricopeptide (TPR) repeat protein|uniref:Tetratricopeptide repeat protein n=1 Tax=Symplocastrum torsivum CPER-KK1 TaxID=450513 RepID=A0A951PML6_9CYAN|nr:tetratricopeptide repeat protein [Symplocastrum torsivum CPER-KK1]
MTNSLTPSGEIILAELNINPNSLVAHVPASKLDDYIAVVNWLKKYKPKSDATNLQKVRGYLEAFHHLCEVEAWEEAFKILSTHLNTPTNEELHNQLNTWGYYREQTELYNRILGKLDPILNAVCLNGLGNLYQVLAEYDKAIECHQQYLAMFADCAANQRR